ncbi:hypothetical protein BDF19DRAFT_178363 [Syncephalis fuscata]|nr:hypothetical protein BDF19DRAFT_178363 [Syncephalis fuscata]
MEKTRLQSVGHHFDASVLTTHSGTFGGGFATGHRRPQWIYRYDAQQIEVRTMNKLAEHIFARITTSQLACDLADELEIEYVCSATLCNLDVLLICTADRFSNESRLFVYDPCLGRQRQLPLPKGRSITCAAVSAPFQIQTPYEMEEENQNEDCTKTIQLLLLGTGTSEMYINHLLLSDDPFGIDPLLDANHYKRLPESHSGPITSIACWTDVLTEQKPSNIICIAWGTSRGKVLLVEYHFNQVMSNGSIEDQFYYIEAIEIADHGQITQIIIQPLENGDTISDSAEEASDDGQSDVAKGWYCIVAQDGTQTRGKPSIVPLVSVCKTIPQKKKWMAVGHVTPFSDSARTGIYGRTLSMA